MGGLSFLCMCVLFFTRAYRFAYACTSRVSNSVFVSAQLRHESVRVGVCVGVCVGDWEKQGVDGSWWVSTPAAATSTLGQLMFSELTGISPLHHSVAHPSSLLLPL